MTDKYDAVSRHIVSLLPHADDDLLQLREASVEKMPAPRKDDHGQLLRPRPVEHVGERHDVVLLAVDHDRVGGDDARPESA